jgi:hypothetical protein
MILVHVGASLLDCKAFGETRLSDEEIRDLKNGRADQDGRTEQDYNLEDNFQVLKKGLEETWKKNNPAWGRDESPAEIASLSLLDSQPEDKIVLLTSDTVAGKFCGALLKDALNPDLQLPPNSKYPTYSDVTVEPIEGVKINESQASGSGTDSQMHFVQDGLVNYVKLATKYYRTLQPGDTLLFNITAGYKGLLPIARDLALLLAAHSRDTHNRNPIQTDMCYLHETSGSLIYYGALPVRFDFKNFQKGDFDAAQQDGLTSEPTELKPCFESNKEQGVWRLTPLGYVVKTVYDELYRKGRRDAGATVPGSSH